MATAFSLPGAWLLHLSHEAELLGIVIDHVRDETSNRRRDGVILDTRRHIRMTTTIERITQWGEGVRAPSRERLLSA